MKTIIEKQSGKVLYCVTEITTLQDNEIAVDELVTENFISAYYNFDTKAFYEGASEEEIEQMNKPDVPSEVPLWSMRIVLKQLGIFEAIIEAINAMDEPLKSMALDYLEYGNFIERNSNTVSIIQQLRQMTDQQVDDLFIACANLKL